MTFLIFFAAAARAGLVSADFGLSPLDRPWCRFTIATIEDHLGGQGLVFFNGRSFPFDDLDFKQSLQGIGLDAVHHGDKHVEPFPFILRQRIFLAIASESDAVPELIHSEEMFLPMVVNDL